LIIGAHRIRKLVIVVLTVSNTSVFSSPLLADVSGVEKNKNTSSSTKGEDVSASHKKTKAISGSYRPLRSQLLLISEVTLLTHRADKDLPNSRFFLALGAEDSPKPKNLQILHDQLTLLISDSQWQYSWQTSDEKTEINPVKNKDYHGKEYILSRRAVTDEDRKVERIKNGMARLKYLNNLVKNWDSESEALKNDDPDLYTNLGYFPARATISLFGSLPEETMKQTLAGKNGVLSINSLSASQLNLMNKAFADRGDKTEFTAQSQETIKLIAILEEQGPDVGLILYSKDGNQLGGHSIMQRGQYSEHEPLREKAAKRRELEANKILAKVSKVDKVTIPWNLPTKSSTEPPLSAYLRAFADQTGLSIVGLWPDPETQPADAKGKAVARLYRRRLSASISGRPLAEALNTLCKVYGSAWRLDAPEEEAEIETQATEKVLKEASATDKDQNIGCIIRFWAAPPTFISGSGKQR
jgi:hypothetical protein